MLTPSICRALAVEHNAFGGLNSYCPRIPQGAGGAPDRATAEASTGEGAARPRKGGLPGYWGDGYTRLTLHFTFAIKSPESIYDKTKGILCFVLQFPGYNSLVLLLHTLCTGVCTMHDH